VFRNVKGSAQSKHNSRRVAADSHRAAQSYQCLAYVSCVIALTKVSIKKGADSAVPTIENFAGRNSAGCIENEYVASKSGKLCLAFTRAALS